MGILRGNVQFSGPGLTLTNISSKAGLPGLWNFKKVSMDLLPSTLVLVRKGSVFGFLMAEMLLMDVLEDCCAGESPKRKAQ